MKFSCSCWNVPFWNWDKGISAADALENLEPKNAPYQYRDMNMNILNNGNNEKISYLWKSAVGSATLNLTKYVARTSATYKISSKFKPLNSFFGYEAYFSNVKTSSKMLKFFYMYFFKQQDNISKEMF